MCVHSVVVTLALFVSAAQATSPVISAPASQRQTPAVVVERDFYYSTFKAQLLLERYVPEGAMLFFGDSLIQGLNIESLHRYPVNFGITGDTSAGLLHRLREYKSVKTAGAVVLESGVNDLGFGDQFDKKIVHNYARMLALLPQSLDIYLIAIFPVNETINPEFINYNKRIRAINRGLARLCHQDQRCIFINIGTKLTRSDGNVRAKYLRPKDGVHLNNAGMSIVLDAVRSHLNTVENDADKEDHIPENIVAPCDCPP